MRILSITTGTLAAMTLLALTLSCNNPATNLPTNPSTPSVSSVEIIGPVSMAPGQSAQFAANIHFSDGTIKAASPATNVRWQSSNTGVMQVSTAGVGTARQLKGETTLTAEVTLAAVGVRRSTREVVVVPDGTYRVVGVVSEAEFPTSRLAGARVEVTSGTPLVTITNSSGEYRLYGVGADVEVKVTLDGYKPAVQNLRFTSHTTQNFPLTLAGARITLGGPYTLAIDVVGACSGTMPADLQHRRYDAVLTQNGPTVEVELTEARFRLNTAGRGNRFSGRVDAAGATFTLEDYSYYDYFYFSSRIYPNLAERLSDGTFLIATGTVVTTGSAAGLSGPLKGSIMNWDSRFPSSGSSLGYCSSTLHQFTLTPR